MLKTIVLALPPLTCQLLLWLAAMARNFFEVAENLKFSFFLNPPIGTAPRPELLFDVLVGHFSQKAVSP